MKKSTLRLLAVLVACVLLATLAPLYAANAATDYSTIRVRLDSLSASSLTFKPVGNYYVQENTQLELASGATYTLSVSGANVVLSGGSLGAVNLGSTANLIQAKASGENKGLQFNGKGDYYPGNFKLSVVSGKIQLINTVYFEDYITGVIDKEVGNSFPTEAMKAAALSARSYALQYMGSNRDYDVVNTTSNQVYGGYPYGSANCISVVEATKGQVITYNGSIVDGVYCATNGGQIMDGNSLWGGANTYGVIKDDPYELRTTYSGNQKNVYEFGKDGAIGDATLKNLVLEQIAAQTPANLAFEPSAQQDEQLPVSGNLPGDGQPAATPTATPEITPAPTATLEPTPTPAVGEQPTPTPTATPEPIPTAEPTATAEPSPSPATPNGWSFRSASASNIVITAITDVKGVDKSSIAHGGDYYDANTKRFDNLQVTLKAKVNGGSEQTYTIKLSLATLKAQIYPNHYNMKVVTVADNGSTFTVTHAGYSHGVGMSQQGAYQMAKEGMSLQQIINFYYGGAKGEAGTKTIAVNRPSLPDRPAVNTPTQAPTQTPTQAPTQTGTVKASSLNVRSGPGTGYSRIGSLANGATVTILGASGGWYQISYNGGTGYVSADYIVLSGGGGGSTNQTGKVKASSLNVRSGPGTGYSRIGSLANGATVTILGSSGNWYQINYNGRTGYVSKDYVTVTSSPIQTPTQAPTQTPTQAPTQTPGQTGTVKASSLNVRSGPGTGYSRIGSLPNGASVTILGTSNGWYQISYNGGTGYVSASYVTLNGGGGGGGTGSGTTGTVKASSLNVRSGPGTGYSRVGSLANGATVTILGSSGNWYQISYNGGTAYVSKDYVVASGGSSSGGGSATASNGTVTASSLIVRSGPGTNYSRIGGLSRGTRVTILSVSGGWYKIVYNGGSAYVSADYVTIS